MNLNWRELTAARVPLESVFALLAEANEQAYLSTLALTFAKMQLWRYGALGLKPVLYDPKLTYSPGISLQLSTGGVTPVRRINPSYNPVQGQFQDLTFTEAYIPRLAASLGPFTPASAPLPDLAETEVEEQVPALPHSGAGPRLRCSVIKTLQANKRWAGFAAMSSSWSKNCLI